MKKSILLIFLLLSCSHGPLLAQKPVKKPREKAGQTTESTASFCFFNAVPKPMPVMLFLNGQPLPGKGLSEGADSGSFRLVPGKHRLEVQNGDLPILKVPLNAKKNEATLNMVLLDQVLDADQKVMEEKLRLHSIPFKKQAPDVYHLSLLSACGKPVTVKVNKDTHELAPLQLKEVEGWKGGALKAAVVGSAEGGASPAETEPEAFAPDLAAHYILVFFDKADGDTGVRMLLAF